MGTVKHLLVFFVWLCAGGAFGQNWTEKDFLSRAIRLTFEGRRAGEGYFSPDGTQMVFQSEREPGNPFYQIYLPDLTTGDSKRISSGQGKTTCVFFQASTDNILFALS
jgi:Tol biopolymer transport system component